MTFKHTLALCGASAALACTLTAGTALASGPVAVAPEPPVTFAPPPVAYDWSGFYGGLSASRLAGQINENPGGGVFPDLEDDTGFGVFLGYNWQRGNFVYGAELSYINFETPYVGYANSLQQNALELRARAGWSFDRYMVYGFVGAARSSMDDVGTDYNQSGISYGLGLQAMLGGNMFAGLELARRDVSGSTSGQSLGADIDTVSLRIGYQF